MGMDSGTVCSSLTINTGASLTEVDTQTYCQLLTSEYVGYTSILLECGN